MAFISHSFENKPEFENITDALQLRGVDFWNPGEIRPGGSLREQLRAAVERCTLCIFIATRQSINSSWCGAELGAFWGAGKPIIVYLAEASLKEDELPHIIQGDVWERRISKIADRAKEIKNSAFFNRRVTIVPKLQLADPASSKLTYPKKLVFEVTNSETSPVVVTSRYFQMTARLKGHADRSTGAKNKFKVEFLAYTDKSGKDVYQLECLLRPGASVRAWLALDNGTNDEAIREAFEGTQVGTWRVACHWLAESVELREYDFEF